MRSIKRAVCIAGIVLVSFSAFAKDKPSGSDKSSKLTFNVVKDDNNKPVRNASVILHLVSKDGKQTKGGFQLKTDNEGNTETEGIPFGLIRIQVLAPGFQTFGDDYTINQPETEIKVRLKRPSDQMSVYDKPPSKPPEAPPATPPAEPKPN